MPGLAVKPVKAPKVVTQAAPREPNIALPGEGSTTPTNPNQHLIGFEDYEKLRAQANQPAPAAAGGAPVGPTGAGHSDLVSFAKKFVGVKYVWGGTSPLSGFDCSGFTQYVFRQFGVNLPRVSAAQGTGGRAISMSEVQAGDLLATDNSPRNKGADHVAIAIGGGMMISAPAPGQSVHIVPIPKSGYWARRYL